ncbi:hypothetical protein ACFLVG_04255 [Chloroflexota bacterium]
MLRLKLRSMPTFKIALYYAFTNIALSVLCDIGIDILLGNRLFSVWNGGQRWIILIGLPI